MSRGGAREGAGRKAVQKPRVLLTASVSQDTKDYLNWMVTAERAPSIGKAIDMAVETLKDYRV